MPAKRIGMRFDESTIQKFLEMKWWDWNPENIYEAIPLLESEKYEELYSYYLENIKKSSE